MTKDSSEASDTSQASPKEALDVRPPARGRLSLSRRQFWRVVTAAVAVAALPVTHQVIVRRRRRGEPGPTGWFGHC